MKNKGFTLVELLAVIVILGVLAGIGYTSVSSVIMTSKERAYNEQVASIIKAAKDWAVEHTEELPEINSVGGCNTQKEITVTALVNGGYLEKNPIDPRNNTNMTGNIIISCQNHQYQYEYPKIESK